MSSYVLILILIAKAAWVVFVIPKGTLRNALRRVERIFEPIPYMAGWIFVWLLLFKLGSQILHSTIVFSTSTLTTVAIILGICVGVFHYLRAKILEISTEL